MTEKTEYLTDQRLREIDGSWVAGPREIHVMARELRKTREALRIADDLVEYLNTHEESTRFDFLTKPFRKARRSLPKWSLGVQGELQKLLDRIDALEHERDSLKLRSNTVEDAARALYEDAQRDLSYYQARRTGGMAAHLPTYTPTQASAIVRALRPVLEPSEGSDDR